MTLATQIKTIRKQLNLTQEDVSDHLGISRVSITQWESGQTAPSISRLRKLADFFGVTLEALLGDETNIISSVNPKEKRSKRTNAPANTSPAAIQTSIRIPIRGYAQGDYISTGNAVKKPIGFLDLVSSFRNIVDLYAVYITGDSMANEHRHGDTRLVAPHSPCKIGDTVVVVKKASGDKPETSYIKTYTEKRTLPSGKVMLHFNQTNPPAELIFEQVSIIQMHKVLTYNELLGLQS